jgi:hypothetical protein
VRVVNEEEVKKNKGWRRKNIARIETPEGN